MKQQRVVTEREGGNKAKNAEGEKDAKDGFKKTEKSEEKLGSGKKK